jgi:hypothetical protein
MKVHDETEPTAEMLAAYPDLQFRLTTPEPTAPAAASYSTRFPGIDASLLKPLVFGNATQPVRAAAEITSDLSVRVDLVAAQQAIAAKQQELGSLPGAPRSGFRRLDGGAYARFYDGADIYYSDRTGAHEVHGDIRAKYNALLGPAGWLGLPITDERGTPDQRGRYNHFEHGSIYWTENTGPMAVHGAIRDLWASLGWEHSFFGYPVQDQHRIVQQPLNESQHVALFENGGLFSSGPQAEPALIAQLLPEHVAALVRRFFDDRFHDQNRVFFGAGLPNLGIEGPVTILHVSDWEHGFWASRPRQVTFVVNGFNSLVPHPLVPDPTFRLEVTLEFGLSWEMAFTGPVNKTLTAALTRLHVHTSGIGHQQLHEALRDGILAAFQQPVAIRTIPAEAHLMGIVTTKAGGLQFLIEPTIPDPVVGRIRRMSVQRELDALVAEL